MIVKMATVIVITLVRLSKKTKNKSYSKDLWKFLWLKSPRKSVLKVCITNKGDNMCDQARYRELVVVLILILLRTICSSVWFLVDFFCWVFLKLIAYLFSLSKEFLTSKFFLWRWNYFMIYLSYQVLSQNFYSISRKVRENPFLHICSTEGPVRNIYVSTLRFARVGTIAGVILGVLVSIVIGVCVYLWWWRRKNAKIERLWLMQLDRANNISSNMIMPFRTVCSTQTRATRQKHESP